MPLLAQGKVLGGFGLTEAEAGSDAGGTQTMAEDRGDHYLLRGSKIFITHAGVGEIFVVTARTDPKPKTRNHGITSFIVTKDTVDLAETNRVGIGHDADLAQDARVSGQARRKTRWGGGHPTRGSSSSRTRSSRRRTCWAQEGKGFVNFLTTLDSGRIGVGALSLGIAQGALDEAMGYTTTRKQFEKPIASFQGVHFQLADMATEIQAARHLVYHAAWLYGQGKPHKQEAAMAKLYASEALHARHDQGRPAPWRLRLHRGLPGRADDAGCQGLRDRGGDQRDPADGDRPSAPGGCDLLTAGAGEGGSGGRGLSPPPPTPPPTPLT